MVKYQCMESFINYNYIPFSKMQCIKRILLIWFFGFLLCVLGKNNVSWAILLGVVNICISGMFVYLMMRLSQSNISRFLCDGVFYLHMAVILNLASYRVMSLQIWENILLCFILLFLLFICILIFLIAVYINIKKDKYNSDTQNGKIISFPFLGALGGMLVAQIILKDQSQQFLLTMVAFLLLILSFMISIGSINLLKVFLVKVIGKKY